MRPSTCANRTDRERTTSAREWHAGATWEWVVAAVPRGVWVVWRRGASANRNDRGRRPTDRTDREAANACAGGEWGAGATWVMRVVAAVAGRVWVLRGDRARTGGARAWLYRDGFCDRLRLGFGLSELSNRQVSGRFTRSGFVSHIPW